MSVFFRCDHCGKDADPRQLFKVYAMTVNMIPAVVIELHKGDLCTACVEAIKACLPQIEKAERAPPQPEAPPEQVTFNEHDSIYGMWGME